MSFRTSNTFGRKAPEEFLKASTLHNQTKLAESKDNPEQAPPQKPANSIDLSRMEAICRKIGFNPSEKIINRLNSLSQKNQLKQKIDTIWSRVSRINRENEQQFEAFKLREKFNSQLKKSLYKSKPEE